MMSRHASRAFTLIEVMVVVGIVAILALIAAPSYMDQYIRNQIVESVPLADIAKSPVAASWLLLQGFPRDNGAAGLPVPGKIVNNHIRSVTVEDGAIQIEFGHSVNSTVRGQILSLRPAVVEDAPVVPVTWVCGYASGPPPMTVHGVNRTNVPERFLPLNCRKR